jgi:hypothetical protein
MGYGSRYFHDNLPYFISEYAGDTFWAFAAYYLIKSFWMVSGKIYQALFALGFSFTIEFSQLYKADWIEAIRSTFLGGLALGFGFHWSDLLCYVAGVCLAFGFDLLLDKK